MAGTRPLIAAASATAAVVLAGAATGRTDGSPPPPVTAGLQLWFEADQAPQADGAPVTLWADQSGFGRDLSQQAGTTPPVMRRGVVGGRAAIEFNGVSDMLKTYSKSFTIAQPDTVFVVYRALDDVSNPNGAALFDSRNSSVRQDLGRPSPGTSRLYANLDLDASVAYPFPSFEIWDGQFNGASSSLRLNGGTVAAGNAGAASMSGFTVGGLSSSGPYGYNFGHNLVAEILVYQGAMSDAARRSVVDWLDGKYGLLPPVAPASSTPPAVTGTPTDATTVAAQAGSWTGGSPISFDYQWQSCSGGTCSDLPGATGTTYAPTLADTGRTLRVRVTATNPYGSATATSADSAVVAGTPPSDVVPPSITGSPVDGQTLTADPGTWTGDPTITYSYRWRRCNSAGTSCVQVGTAATYALGPIDDYSIIQLAVTAANAVKAVTAPNVDSAAVQPAAPTNTAVPVTSHLELWYDASQETYANGEPVMRFTDRSGNGRDLSTTDPTAAPTFKRDIVGRQPVLEFDGVTDLLKTYGSTFSLAQPDTFFIVYKALNPDTTTARTFVFDSTDSNVRQVFGRPAAGTNRMYANIDMDFPGVAYPFRQFELWGGIFDGTSSELNRQGAVVGTGNAGGSNLSGFALGGLSTSGTLGYDLGKFQVATVLYYSARLDAADRQAIVSWLDARYGVLQAPVLVDAGASVAGTAMQGQALVASTGSWGGQQPIAFAYQWRRCDATGNSCANIAGATDASYTLATPDVGKTVRVVVTASNSVGSAASTSPQTSVVAGATPVNTDPPTIAGSATQGRTLSASTGDWGGTAPITYVYSWERCDSGGANCVDTGGTAATYTLAAMDVGATMRVRVTATNSLGSGTASSATTAKVASSAAPDAPPPVTAGLQLWYDAASETYADGEPVALWPDHSGSARDLTADPADPRTDAVYRRDAVGGRPAVEFNGTTSLLKTYGSSFTIDEPDTFFVVYRSLDTNPLQEGWLFDSTNSLVRQLFGRASDGTVELYANLKLSVPGIAFPFPGFELWSGTYDGGTSTLWRKTAGQPTQSYAGGVGTSSMQGFAVGAASTTGPNGYGFTHALVAEVLWYSGHLSETDRTSVLSYLAGKYGLS